MKELFHPRASTLILFAVFLVIFAGGTIQSTGFGGPEGKESPLYKAIRPFPFWIVWVCLSMPLAVVAAPLRSIGVDLIGGSPWLFTVVSVVYFYVLACLLVAAARLTRSN